MEFNFHINQHLISRLKNTLGFLSSDFINNGTISRSPNGGKTTCCRFIICTIRQFNQKSGHFYIELADSANDKTTARSFATIWASTYSTIVNEIGLKETQSILQPGNKVLINVKIEFHTIYGLKLKIRAIDPAYSYGEIERKRQEVIKRLKKEGIYDLQKELRLPTIIKRIALIGSPNTSGYRDFQNELLVNHDFNNFVIKEFPVRVQGDAAVKEIVAA